MLSGAAGCLYKSGARSSAYSYIERLAKLHNPRILHIFYSWEREKDRSILRIDRKAKSILLRSIKSNVEDLKFVAATMLARSGYEKEALPTLTEIIKTGNNFEHRWKSMRLLQDLGDEKSKKIIEEAKEIEELKLIAEDILKYWDYSKKK